MINFDFKKMIISACAHKNVNSDEVCIAKKLKIWIQVEECLKNQNPSINSHDQAGGCLKELVNIVPNGRITLLNYTLT